MAYATGSLLGPIIGGELYDSQSFQTCTNAFAASSLVFAFLYAFVVYIPSCRGKDKVGFAPPLDEPEETSTPLKSSPVGEETFLIPKRPPVSIIVSRASDMSERPFEEITELNASHEEEVLFQ